MSLPELMDMVGKDGRFQVFVMFALLSTHVPQYWSNAIMSYASYEPDWCCVYDSDHPRPPNASTSSSCIDLSHTPTHTQGGTGKGNIHGDGTNGIIDTLNSTSFSYYYYSSSFPSSSSSSSLSSLFKGRSWNDEDYDDNNCDLKDFLDCHTKEYIDDTQATTAVTEWNLTCDRHWLSKLITTIQMLGLLTGALASGAASDIWGRKGVYIASCVMCAAFNGLTATADSWELFAGFKFFVGISMGIYLVTDMPYLFEFLSDRWRLIAACTPSGVLGLTAFPLVAWAVHDLVWIHIVTCIFMVVLTLPGFLVPESIRWLTVKGHTRQAVTVSRSIATWNGRLEDFDDVRAHRLIRDAYESTQREKELAASADKQYSYLDLYRNKEMAWLTVRLQFLWFSASVIVQGVLFDVEALDGDIYVNMFLTSVFDAPLALITYYFINRMGRRVTTCVLLAVATAVSIVGLVVNVTSASGHAQVEKYTSIAMKALWTGVGVYNMVVTNEVYPTQLRSYGMGMTQLATLIGGAMAAFSVDLDKAATRSFGVMMGLTIIAFVIVLMTKECDTSTMADTETLYQSGLYPTPTGSLYQSIERYPVHQQYYRPKVVPHQGQGRDDDLGDDGSVSYTSLTSLLTDPNTRDKSYRPPPTPKPADEDPVMVRPETYPDYGAVTSSPTPHPRNTNA